MAVGGLAAATIVVMAVRHPPRRAIVPAETPDFRRRLLVVLGSPLDDASAETLARIVEEDEDAAPELLLIAPCRSRFLERWSSDLGPGRHRAQRNLVLSAALLARAGIAGTARVGDEDVVQMTEDELRSFPATEVVLVDGEAAEAEAKDLRARLRVRFRWLMVDLDPAVAIHGNGPDVGSPWCERAKTDCGAGSRNWS